MVCAACIAYILILPHQSIVDEVNIPAIIYLGLLVAYSLLSYIWAVNKDEALYYSTLLIRNAFVFVLFSALFRKRIICLKANYFYLFVLLAYLGTALWEMITWQHLPSSRFYGGSMFIPSGPFYGENLLAAFSLMLFPYLLFLPKLHKGFLLKLVSGLLVLTLLVVITIQGARIALLAAMGLTFWVFIRYTSHTSKWVGFMLLLLVAVGVSHFAGKYVKIAASIAQYELNSIGSENTSMRMSSVKIRKQLIKESLDLTSNSAFMGVGAGNFERYMNTERKHRTGGIVNPHNYFLELMGNFGMGFLLFFLFLYLGWLHGLWNAVRYGDPKLKHFYLMHFYALLLFIPAAAMPSSIKWNHFIWILFAMANRISHPNFWKVKDINEQL